MASFRYMLLLSKDVPAAAKFLSEGLGMRTTVITEKWAELQSGDSTVAVKEVESEMLPTNVNPSPMIVFDVSDVQTSLTRLLSLGAEMDGAIQYSLEGNKIATIRAPDGHMIGLIEQPTATWGQWFREGKNVFDGLAAAYGLLATVALVQIIRIQIRVPEYGWTTQKVFHLLNLLVSGLRATVFAFREPVQGLSALPRTILLDLPGLLFFSTYTLLVLFWAEIYYQARSLPVSSLRPGFVGINMAVYSTQIVLWLACSLATVPEHQQLAREVSGCFLALVSAAAAGGFLLYGGRLFLMLRRFPIESRGRRKKLREVGMVTSICATCFLFRSIIMAWSTFDQVHADLDVLGHPLLNLVYYGGAEVIPSALVLYILRKLPPKRTPQPEQEYEELPQE